MKKTITVIGIITALFFSRCGDSKQQGEGSEMKGGIVAGGVLRVNEVENIKSLMPIAINEMNNFHIASQVYEGLVKYNQNDLAIVPAIARSWDISDDQMEYTFHIRQNVR